MLLKICSCLDLAYVWLRLWSPPDMILMLSMPLSLSSEEQLVSGGNRAFSLVSFIRSASI